MILNEANVYATTELKASQLLDEARRAYQQQNFEEALDKAGHAATLCPGNMNFASAFNEMFEGLRQQARAAGKAGKSNLALKYWKIIEAALPVFKSVFPDKD